MSASPDSTLILIPALNAEQSLETLIQEIRRHMGSVSILVVDDGSSDQTSIIAENNKVHVIKHQQNRGKGAALQTGFEAVLAMPSVEYVITMDADLQHKPEDIPGFLKQQAQSGADIIIGCRQRVGSGMPWTRIVSNTITSALVSIRTGYSIQDSQCGFRLLRKNVLQAIRLENSGYEAETELLMKAAKRGMKIEFVPVQTVYGEEKSYMTHWNTTKKFITVLLKEYV